MAGDVEKTKAELVAELTVLRQQVAAQSVTLAKHQKREEQSPDTRLYFETVFESNQGPLLPRSGQAITPRLP